MEHKFVHVCNLPYFKQGAFTCTSYKQKTTFKILQQPFFFSSLLCYLSILSLSLPFCDGAIIEDVASVFNAA